MSKEARELCFLGEAPRPSWLLRYMGHEPSQGKQRAWHKSKTKRGLFILQMCVLPHLTRHAVGILKAFFKERDLHKKALLMSRLQVRHWEWQQEKQGCFKLLYNEMRTSVTKTSIAWTTPIKTVFIPLCMVSSTTVSWDFSLFTCTYVANAHFLLQLPKTTFSAWLPKPTQNEQCKMYKTV